MKENTDLKTFFEILREERAAETPDPRKIAVLDYLVTEGYMFEGWVSANKHLSRVEFGEHGFYLVIEHPMDIRNDIGSRAGYGHTTNF